MPEKRFTNQQVVARLSKAKDMPQFLAQSPPAWNASYMPSSPRHTPGQHPQGPPFTSGSQGPARTESPLTLYAPGGGLGISGIPEEAATPGDIGRTPSATIGILPSSLPEFHHAFMRGSPHPSTKPQQPQTPQNAPALGRKGIKPGHPRVAAGKLESLTPLSQSKDKKPRQTRWQFGIRSRNSPLEAVGCIYRGLKKMGAEWVVPEREGEDEGECSEGDYSGSESESDADCSGDEGRHMRGSYESAPGRRRSTSRVHSSMDDMRIPEDPWVIHCRWRKDHLFKPTSEENTPSGTPEGHKRYSFTPVERERHGDESLYVHMEIQLYQLEQNFYLVDFKCAGYERIEKDDEESTEEQDGQDGEQEDEDEYEQGEEKKVKKVGFLEELGGDASGGGDVIKTEDSDGAMDEENAKKEKGGGRKQEEKDVSSPFPFLDLAGKLIIQLAAASEE